MPRAAWPFCEKLYDHVHQIFKAPTDEQLHTHTVVVCTYDHSAVFWGTGLARGHFSHILLDEAANALEPRAMIPLQLAAPETAIVLAGDDRQIAPQVQSPSASHHGLKRSMLLRLCNSDFFAQPGTQAELSINYRSHPALLQLPSDLFYNGMLTSGADLKKVNAFCKWPRLPVKYLPLLFVGVEGRDEQSAESASFMNKKEAMMVVDLVQKLLLELKGGQATAQPGDIAVVTAYYRQTQLVRKYLQQREIYGVDVGGVENIQGREKKAVFVTCVRARRQLMAYDQKFGLGFLFDEKRLNTALTRATSLLVLVADPYVVAEEPHWRKLLQWCVQLKCYQGPDINEQHYIESRRKQEDADAKEEALELEVFAERELREQAAADAARRQREADELARTKEQVTESLRRLAPTQALGRSRACATTATAATTVTATGAAAPSATATPNNGRRILDVSTAPNANASAASLQPAQPRQQPMPPPAQPVEWQQQLIQGLPSAAVLRDAGTYNPVGLSTTAPLHGVPHHYATSYATPLTHGGSVAGSRVSMQSSVASASAAWTCLFGLGGDGGLFCTSQHGVPYFTVTEEVTSDLVFKICTFGLEKVGGVRPGSMGDLHISLRARPPGRYFTPPAIDISSRATGVANGLATFSETALHLRPPSMGGLKVSQVAAEGNEICIRLVNDRLANNAQPVNPMYGQYAP